MSITHWIKAGFVPGVWGLIGGAAAAALARAMGADPSLSRGIRMLATIAVAGGLGRRIRDAAERDDATEWESSPDRYEGRESAQNWRR